jgi:hypothetical protein
MKKILGILIVLAVLAVAAFFALSNPLGRLVKLTIENFGPDMLHAEVRVSDVQISTADGQGKLSGLHLGNPRGFKTDHAFNADTVEIVIEPASIAQDVIVLHKVLIDAPHIIYEKGDSGKNSGGATSAQVVKAIIAELNAKLILALAKAAVITGVGGVTLGAGMAIKSLLGK